MQKTNHKPDWILNTEVHNTQVTISLAYYIQAYNQ